ncbi:glycosyl transferase family 41-domain-containing protein [Baffinella frigidus]|nr:glycosyl transferase family 41-domain-containing protein [Cryptophyta sp. CCMP2293]
MTPLLPIDSHLAIKALADVALDTEVFNGHTTGADTLWAGLPLVSHPGEQMRSRAGASMAHAMGVVTFLARTREEYEDVAVRIASSPAKRERAKAQVRAAGDSSPFFNTALWTKGMERACFQQWELVQATGDARGFHTITSADSLHLDAAGGASAVPSFDPLGTAE